MPDRSQISYWLAENIRYLRETMHLTQLQLAKKSGIPRATWANLESGSANPTLNVLSRAAASLQVTIEELIGPPRLEWRLVRGFELRHRQKDGVQIRKLLPEPLRGLDLERLALPAGARMRGAPHTPGTREYLICEIGQIELSFGGEKVTLDEGDLVVFRGDQKHSYHNPGRGAAVGFSVILLSPTLA